MKLQRFILLIFIFLSTQTFAFNTGDLYMGVDSINKQICQIQVGAFDSGRMQDKKTGFRLLLISPDFGFHRVTSEIYLGKDPVQWAQGPEWTDTFENQTYKVGAYANNLQYVLFWNQSRKPRDNGMIYACVDLIKVDDWQSNYTYFMEKLAKSYSVGCIDHHRINYNNHSFLKSRPEEYFRNINEQIEIFIQAESKPSDEQIKDWSYQNYRELKQFIDLVNKKDPSLSHQEIVDRIRYLNFTQNFCRGSERQYQEKSIDELADIVQNNSSKFVNPINF